MSEQRSNEAAVENEIEMRLSRGDVRLFRNNVGGCYDRTGRFIAYGLGSKGGKVLKGPSDRIGWRSVVITPDMVGQRIAVFAAVEVKDGATATPEQLRFIAAVQEAGGLAGVAHNVEEARAILGM